MSANHSIILSITRNMSPYLSHHVFLHLKTVLAKYMACALMAQVWKTKYLRSHSVVFA